MVKIAKNENLNSNEKFKSGLDILLEMLERKDALLAQLVSDIGAALAGGFRPGPTVLSGDVGPAPAALLAPADGEMAKASPADEQLPRMTAKDLMPTYEGWLKGRMKISSVANVVNQLTSGSKAKSLLESHCLDELDWKTVQAWLDGQERHTVSTRDFLIRLKQMIKWARDREICRLPPEWGKKFEFRRFETRHGQELDTEDFRRLHAACLDRYRTDQGALGALIAIHTGLRIGEICGLQCGDISPEGHTLTVRRTVQRVFCKGKSQVLVGTPKSRTSERVIPLDDEIWGILEGLTAGHKEDDWLVRICVRTHLGCPNLEAPEEPRTLRCHYEQMLKRAGCARYTFHSLRHTFISRSIRAGANPKAVSVYAGHADSKITMELYTHVNQEDLKGVANVNK